MIKSNQVNDILLDVYLMYTNVELFAKYATLSVHYHLLKWQFLSKYQVETKYWTFKGLDKSFHRKHKSWLFLIWIK